MPPTSKNLKGKNCFRVVRPSARSSRFLMHVISYEPCMFRVLKFSIWIPHEIIAALYIFLSGKCVLPELCPSKLKIGLKFCQQYLSYVLESW